MQISHMNSQENWCSRAFQSWLVSWPPSVTVLFNFILILITLFVSLNNGFTLDPFDFCRLMWSWSFVWTIEIRNRFWEESLKLTCNILLLSDMVWSLFVCLFVCLFFSLIHDFAVLEKSNISHYSVNMEGWP